jgi:hypothetical protein
MMNVELHALASLTKNIDLVDKKLAMKELGEQDKMSWCLGAVLGK